jgi:hypothetical protein
VPSHASPPCLPQQHQNAGCRVLRFRPLRVRREQTPAPATIAGYGNTSAQLPHFPPASSADGSMKSAGARLPVLTTKHRGYPVPFSRQATCFIPPLFVVPDCNHAVVDCVSVSITFFRRRSFLGPRAARRLPLMYL